LGDAQSEPASVEETPPVDSIEPEMAPEPTMEEISDDGAAQDVTPEPSLEDAASETPLDAVPPDEPAMQEPAPDEPAADEPKRRRWWPFSKKAEAPPN